MARTRTPPEVTRSRIRLPCAASDLFARQGYKATSVDQIVAAAGYTRGALYWNFKNKRELFLAVYEAALEQASKNILSRVAGSADCRERIERAVVAVIEEAVLHQLMGALRHAYVQEFGRASSSRSGKLLEQYRVLESEMARIIAAGIKRGEFPDQDADLAAVQLVGTVQAVADSLIDDPNRFEGTDVARSTAAFCLGALTGV